MTQKCCESCGQPLLPAHGTTLDGLRLIRNGLFVSLERQEALIMTVLLARFGRTVNKPALLETLYFDNPADEPDNALKMLDVRKYTLRGKLYPLGLGIRTDWGIGMSLHLLDDMQQPKEIFSCRTNRPTNLTAKWRRPKGRLTKTPPRPLPTAQT